MSTFMITIQLPAELTKEFMALIPVQRARISELMDDGKIIQYALSNDRSILWVTVSAGSEKLAKEIISSFPLIDYMEPKFFELAFQNSISTDLPKLIMN